MLTETEKQHLKNSKNVKELYYTVIQEYVDAEVLPANVQLLFEHLLTTKPKKQHAHIIDLNIYFVDYKPSLYRKYPSGWYKVENRIKHPPEHSKKHK